MPAMARNGNSRAPLPLSACRTGLVLVLLSGFLVAETGWAEKHRVPSSVSYVSPTTVKARLEAGQPVTFLDVREADEFTAGHLPGARNIAYDQVASLADQLPHDGLIVVYCIHSTHRAPVAARTLKQLGFNNVYVLEGGIVAWQASGLTIRASDLAQMPSILPFTERCSDKTTP